MVIEEIIFDKDQIINLTENINSICIKCDFIGTNCNICPVEEAKIYIENLSLDGNPDIKPKRYTVLSESEISDEEMEFNKNDILITQNSIESICENCSHLGSYCLDCNIHQIRRNLASLPVKEIQMFEPKEKKSSGGGCGTSCSTGCSTKKKR